jgi:hypothetical protein
MKTKDIPQLITDGNWECDFTLKDLVNRIEEMQVDNKRYKKTLEMNPDFQRGHVWTEEQQTSFIESLLQGGAKNARVIYLNCPDWNNESNLYYHDFVCVDGLQRYTAIKRFINYEIKAFGLYLNEYEDEEIFHGKSFYMRLNINHLQTRAEVLKWYLQVNDGGTPHTKEEVNKVKKLLEEEKCK